MKQYLVGTGVGHFLLQAASFFSLKSISRKNPENASMRANAVLADTLIARLCPSKGTFVDLGAHIGSVLAAVHHLDKSIRIIAVEADPAKAINLSRRFPYCTLHSCAIAETPGQIEFYLNPEATGYNSLVKKADGKQEAISVEVKTLNGLLRDEKPDLIKIDIEGAELGALRGGAEVIRTHRPTIMFESTDKNVNSLGYSPEILWAWFDEMGYGIYVPDRLAHDARPMDLSTFIDGHDYPMRTLNYFAVHEAKRIEVRDRARRILDITPAM
ncbi:FkbM family methyltransferase [uncultured Sulfitobacter sp.]|uniref:FkbM family methyltransferase n=1 Tax=uncultured Sulfitobacter sp. TaxID=191468 RepID=UPI0026040214|nr:FkbM family methyltransferase [uncultured Sulfitobacter sp.]